MKTEWVLDVNCPRKDNFADEPTTIVCAKCTYKIWNHSAVARVKQLISCSVGEERDNFDQFLRKLTRDTLTFLIATTRLGTRKEVQVPSARAAKIGVAFAKSASLSRISRSG